MKPIMFGLKKLYMRLRGSNAVSLAIRFASCQPNLFHRCWYIMLSCLSHFTIVAVSVYFSRVQWTFCWPLFPTRDICSGC